MITKKQMKKEREATKREDREEEVWAITGFSEEKAVKFVFFFFFV